MTLLTICAICVARLADGAENGLHWASAPSKGDGSQYHTADLLETWALRGAYAALLVQMMGPVPAAALLSAGVCTADQALWQMMLNTFSGNGPLSGELKTARFDLFAREIETPKLFRNRRRLIQLALGVAMIAGGLWIA
jgi:hypothetical protein